MLTIVSHARRGDDAPASLASKQGSRHAGSHSSPPPPRHHRHQQDPSASGARARTRGDGAPATIGAHTRAPARRRNVPARRRPSRRRYQPTTCTRCAPASLPRLRHTPERSRTPARQPGPGRQRLPRNRDIRPHLRTRPRCRTRGCAASGAGGTVPACMQEYARDCISQRDCNLALPRTRTSSLLSARVRVF